MISEYSVVPRNAANIMRRCHTFQVIEYAHQEKALVIFLQSIIHNRTSQCIVLRNFVATYQFSIDQGVLIARKK